MLKRTQCVTKPPHQAAARRESSVVSHRELTFRKRAQSAEDEGRVALAESLQHLTLSEFLKEYVASPALGSACRNLLAINPSRRSLPCQQPKHRKLSGNQA